MEMVRRKGLKDTEIKTKESAATEFAKIRVGLKNLDDAIYNIGTYRKADPRLGDKKTILRAIQDRDYTTMREASDFFFETSGIYNRLCRYMAYLYRYDWMITPYVNEENSVKTNKLLNDFNKALLYLDNFEVKRFFGEVALKVIRQGCYYGYLIPQNDRMAIQELPPQYCRSRWSVNNKPVVEFNMRFFDDYFRDTTQKMKMLNLFPNEFKKGYIAYKERKLVPDFPGDTAGWYLLEPENTIKFNLNGEDFPAFIAVIPALIDLDNAQDLDRRKMEQKLLKIIIQQMPIDKNGDLVFDTDEAQELHYNAVQMLGNALGLKVLTTFADVDVADLADKNTTTSVDELEKVERTVYNEAGVSQKQFNTDGQSALEKSILNDEAAMYNLIVQFESFLNMLLKPFNKNSKKYYFRAQLLTTTIYNYKEMSKLYKEQTQMGYSKMLPQIALGQSQSSILANAYFENDVLELFNVFIPPLMSSTMNAEALNKNKTSSASDGDLSTKDSEGPGRKEKVDDEKSEKTIANRESMG